MIDTHSHIFGPEFAEDVDLVIQRARDAGVDKVLLPNINGDTIDPMLSLVGRYPEYLFPMMGLHPTDLTPEYRQTLDDMYARLQEQQHPYVAVGEVGLDYYWDRTYYEEQQDAFERQIQWALEFGLPLSIHARSAHQELMQIMERHRGEGLTGVFHCFGGTRQEAEELLQFEGFVLGIGGVLTYKKSTLPDALQSVPMNRIVLETDSPYLAPVPYRGKRNESSYVAEVLRKLAIIYNVSEEEMAVCTDRNAYRIFPRIGTAKKD